MPDYSPPPATLPPGSIVWAYARDSGGTEQEQSVAQQRQELETYCNRHGLILARVYADLAKSAKTIKGRDQFNALFTAALTDEHPPAGILVWSLSRLARNFNDALRFKATLRAAGIVIHSLTETLPQGDEGLLLETFHDYQNAGYLKKQAESIRRALHANVRNGYTSGGFAPRGYMLERVDIGKHRDGKARTVSRLIPDPDLFPLAQMAWKLRAAGKSYIEITKATRGRLYKAVNCWNSFFANKTYLGIGKAGELEIPNHHEPAVSLEDWQKVQKLAQDRKHRFNGLTHPRRVKYPSLLSGLAYCSNCGAAMVFHALRSRGPGKGFYICGKRDRSKGSLECDTPQVLARVVDAQILGAVERRVLNPPFWEELLEEIKAQFSDSDKLTAQIKSKRAARNELNRAINNLVELAESFGARAAAEKLKQRETELVILEAEIRNLETRKEQSEIDITPEALALVLTTWRAELTQAQEAGDVGAMRSFLARFVTRIELGDHTAKIFYNFPIDADAPIGYEPGRGTLSIGYLPVKSFTLEWR